MRCIVSITAAWVRTIALALALMTLIEKACAQTIVHTVPPQPLYYSDRAPSQSMDVNNDGFADFVLNTPNGLDIDLNPVNGNAILSVPEPQLDLGALIYALNPGANISSSLDPALAWWGTNGNGTPGIVSCSTAGCLGYFQNQTDAYAGIRLDAGGNFYYGWIHIQNLIFNAGQISDWAYETQPNTPIKAGAIPVVVLQAPPEIAQPGYLRLRWQTEIGKGYQIQSKVSLAASLWTNLDFVIVATATNAVADIPITGATRFYRVVEAD